MGKLRKNSGSGLVARSGDRQRSCEETLRNCGALYRANRKRPIAVVDRSVSGSGAPRYRLGCVNFAEAAQYPAVVGYFAELSWKAAVKGGADPDSVIAVPTLEPDGAEAFGYAVARRGKRGIVNVSNGAGIERYRFGNRIEKGERVILAVPVFCAWRVHEISRLAVAVAERGGKTVGIVCAVCGTYPARKVVATEEGKGIPLYGAFVFDEPSYPHDAPEVAAAVTVGDVVMDPHDPDAWAELMGSMGKGGRK